MAADGAYEVALRSREELTERSLRLLATDDTSRAVDLAERAVRLDPLDE